jgi:hypothetical protein
MQRLTARFLLLFALVGTFVPLALAVTAAPPHACCLRKSAHQCHGSDPDERAIRGNSCCNQSYSRAVTTSQWAHLQSSLVSLSVRMVEARLAESRVEAPATNHFASQSTRAPPQLSLA